MENPFADLIPQQQPEAAPRQAQSNPFADLIPEKAAPVARETSATPAQQEPGFFDKYASAMMHGPAIALSTASDLLNTYNKVNPKIPAIAPKDVYAPMGLEKNTVDSVAEGLLGLMPFQRGARVVTAGMEAIPAIAKAFTKYPVLTRGLTENSLALGAQGAINARPGERTEGALTNMLWAPVGAGLGKATDLGVRAANKVYAQSAIPGLVERATEKIKGYFTPEQAAKTLQGNYNQAAGANTANWNRVTDLSNVLDNELTAQGKAFNVTPFNDKLSQFYQSTAKMEPAVRAKYEQALGFAKYIQEQAPQSFTGAVALRQNLNQELKKYLEKNNVKATDKETTNLIKQLKDSLQDTVKANRGNVDKATLGQFENAWSNANKSHMGVQDFFKSPSTEGILKPTRQRREALQGNTLDRAALGKYLRPSLGSNVGINQLNKLSGSNDAARSYVMRNAIEGRGNTNEALKAYERLSVPQREALFAKRPEGEQLKAASYARNTVGETPSKGLPMVGHHIGTLGVPGLTGFLGAKIIGDQDWDTALATGLATAAIAKGGQSAVSRFASPASVTRAANRATTPNKNAGRYLSPVLASMFAPKGEQ